MVKIRQYKFIIVEFMKISIGSKGRFSLTMAAMAFTAVAIVSSFPTSNVKASAAPVWCLDSTDSLCSSLCGKLAMITIAVLKTAMGLALVPATRILASAISDFQPNWSVPAF
jgi:hypothetical protein